MGKVEDLEIKQKELEEAFLSFKREYKNQIYELDENNFSASFLKKIGYTEKKDGDS
jgi:hypothetical protein